MTECIHGFEGTLCDVCFPKKAPEPVRRPATSRSRPSAPTSARGGSQPTQLRTADLRVYHFTHVRNLPAIISDGELRANATPVVDLSSELARELRGTAEVAPGRPVSDFIAFSLAPDSVTWDELRRGAAEPRWSPAARASVPADFVVLVTTVKALGPEAVIADGDAAGTYTRFAVTAEDADRMLARLHGDADARSAAEALAPLAVDFSSVQLIGVAHDPARDDVRAMLTSTGFAPKVAVYPPWFATE